MLSSLLCTALLLGSIVAADVFYNFSGETAFAQTIKVNNPNFTEPNMYGHDGAVSYVSFSKDPLDGTVYKWRGSSITIGFPQLDNIYIRHFEDDDDSYGWITENIQPAYSWQYFSFNGGSTGSKLVITQVGTRSYELWCNYLGQNFNGEGKFKVKDGTIYVDQETGIKIISGNPSWVAAGGYA